MKSARLGDVELFYADRGQGTPVLLAHAFPLDHTAWDAQVEAIGGRFRAIAPDLRGFGRSGLGGANRGKMPVPPSESVSIEQYADDLAALLDALAIDQPVVLGGVSMGGYVALEFWRRHRPRLRALVLCDTRAAADSPEVAAIRKQTAARLVDEGDGVSGGGDAAAARQPGRRRASNRAWSIGCGGSSRPTIPAALPPPASRWRGGRISPRSCRRSIARRC